MSLYIFISRICVTQRSLKSNVAINGSKVSDETHSFALRCTSSCRHRTNKKTTLGPFHLDKSLAANLDLNFSVTPQSYSTAWEIYHILLRDLVLPVADVRSRSRAMTQRPALLTILVYSCNLHVGGPDTSKDRWWHQLRAASSLVKLSQTPESSGPRKICCIGS